jgi:hypothetical protein
MWQTCIFSFPISLQPWHSQMHDLVSHSPPAVNLRWPWIQKILSKYTLYPFLRSSTVLMLFSIPSPLPQSQHNPQPQFWHLLQTCIPCSHSQGTDKIALNLEHLYLYVNPLAPGSKKQWMFSLRLKRRPTQPTRHPYHLKTPIVKMPLMLLKCECYVTSSCWASGPHQQGTPVIVPMWGISTQAPWIRVAAVITVCGIMLSVDCDAFGLTVIRWG